MDPRSDTSLSQCWQCGAPADPDCAYSKRLNRYVARRPGGWVYRPVETMKLPIPRCACCRTRDWIAGVAAFTAFFGGGLVAGDRFPTIRWIDPVGAFAGLLGVMLVSLLYARYAGVRSVESYPPLRALRQAGWSEPN